MLQNINSPEDIRGLSIDELKALASVLRSTIIKGVSEGGGHLASSLGAVELSIVLHYVFNTPEDKIVWDVGHQSYAHKLLTGRYRSFPTLRKLGGISGFPKRSESPYDSFGTGHSSTSISAATGMIEARDRLGKKFKVIAVIGDGAMTSGLAFEGLNHAGQIKKDLIVVLNDNEMSISKNVGALSEYLTRIMTGDAFIRVKKVTKQIMESIPKVGGRMSKFAQRVEEHLKGLFLPGVIFEELGFNYIGPVDGHNLENLIETFGKLKVTGTPTLIHVITKKGKGYEFSERDPSVFHGVGPFDPETGSIIGVQQPESMAYSEAMGDIVSELADADPRVVAITAAMKEGTGLSAFAQRHPERFYDVGIAEPHAVTFAAGMAAEGARPVVAIYSTFLQRSYDEIVHDVCLQGLPVIFAVDRAGLVGEDGPTHHGVYDLSYLRHIPGLTVMAPSGHAELRAMFSLALKHDGPVAIRFPRGKIKREPGPAEKVEMGRSKTLSEGTDIALFAVGGMVAPALEAAGRLRAEGISAMVIDARFVKPLDMEAVRAAAALGRVITIEDNAVQGGFGSAVAEALHAIHMHGVELRMLGIPDEFVLHGTQAELRKTCGIDADGIHAAALAMMREDINQPTG